MRDDLYYNVEREEFYSLTISQATWFLYTFEVGTTVSSRLAEFITEA